MSYRQLRTLTRAQMNWQRVLAGWSVHDITVSLSAPVQTGRLLVISADHGAWRAVIDAREWLCHELPELATLAGAACDDEKIMALFNTHSRPLTFAHRALAYGLLQAEGFMERDSGYATPLPRLSARECTLWLTHITDSLVMKPQTAGARLLGMPLAVEWIIGSSRLLGALAKKLSVGDVLLINEATHQLRCQGMIIGNYWQNEEMIMMEEKDRDHDISAGNAIAPSATETIGGVLTTVPLKVEFILQQRYLTIGELQQLFKGKVLEIDPAGEKNIEIRANGHVLAVGELVQLEDRLGVEITELRTDSFNDK